MYCVNCSLISSDADVHAKRVIQEKEKARIKTL